jgi:iron-sulfur cluster repair protein YtfE (RIC family)
MENHPELRRVESTLQPLYGDLNSYMFKEEQILFPCRGARFHQTDLLEA